MKKVIIMALILAPLSLFAQQKFGHFDSSVIVQAMPEYKTSQTELQTLSKQYEDELTRMRDELQKKSQEYDKQRDSLPDNVKQRREQELNELGQKIQTFEQVANQDIQQQQQKLMAPIYEKINTAIKAVGDENGYTYILEDSQVIYKNPTANDVTPLVKAKLNLKDAPATPTTTPAKK